MRGASTAEETNRVVQEPDEASDHELGPIRLDPLSNQYRASCSCGAEFGPLLNAGMVHAAFAAHRRVSVSPSDS